jgi:hypothetical protein
MYGMDSFKASDTQQAKLIKIFKNARQKLLKTNAAILDQQDLEDK